MQPRALAHPAGPCCPAVRTLPGPDRAFAVSDVGSVTSGGSVTQGLLRNASFQASPQIYLIKSLHLNKMPRGL